MQDFLIQEFKYNLLSFVDEINLGDINIVTGTRSGDIYFVSVMVSEEFKNKDPDVRDHLHLMYFNLKLDIRRITTKYL